MPVLPAIVLENGYKNLGLLSTLYLTKKEEKFYAGLFEKDNELNLVVKVKENSFASFKVSNHHIEDLLRGKKRLVELMNLSKNPDSMIPENVKPTSKLTWTLYTFLMESANRIYTIPNAYYYWNEFQYALKR
jgi:hypothetical protein